MSQSIAKVVVVHLCHLLNPIDHKLLCGTALYKEIQSYSNSETIIAILFDTIIKDGKDTGLIQLSEFLIPLADAQAKITDLLLKKGIENNNIRFCRYNSQNHPFAPIIQFGKDVVVFSHEEALQEYSQCAKFQFKKLYPASYELNIVDIMYNIDKIAEALQTSKKILLSLNVGGNVIFTDKNGQVFFNRSIFNFFKLLKDRFAEFFSRFEIQFVTGRVLDADLSAIEQLVPENHTRKIITQFLECLAEEGITIKNERIIALGKYDNGVKVFEDAKAIILNFLELARQNIHIVHIDSCPVQLKQIKALNSPNIDVISVSTHVKFELTPQRPVKLITTFNSNRQQFFKSSSSDSDKTLPHNPKIQ